MTSSTKESTEVLPKGEVPLPDISRPFGLQVTITRPLGIAFSGAAGPAGPISGDVKLTFDSVTEVAANIQKPAHLMLEITRPGHVTLDTQGTGGKPFDIQKPGHVTLDIQKPGHIGFTLAQPNQMAIAIDQAQVSVTVS